MRAAIRALAALLIVFMRFDGSCEDGLAAPSDIRLGASIRKQNLSSPLGRIELRWPRTAEKLFGRTPERATVEAAQTVSRALKQGHFPFEAQRFQTAWDIVFMDADLPEAQVPAQLRLNCHPGWMTPPANIYVVAQRIAGNCGGGGTVGSGVADAELARVLVHEMGHAVEFALLGTAGFEDRQRAEGFAAWFEGFAGRYSSIAPTRFPRPRAADVGSAPLSAFDGSPFSYARAALMFEAVVDKRGMPGLFDVYAAIKSERISFLEAVQKRLGWGERDLKKYMVDVSSRL